MHSFCCIASLENSAGHPFAKEPHPPYHPARDDDDQVVMQNVASLLEKKVRQMPEQWYPFNQIYEDEMVAGL